MVTFPRVLVDEPPVASLGNGATERDDILTQQLCSYSKTAFLIQQLHLCHNQVDVKSRQTNTRHEALGKGRDVGQGLRRG